MKAIQKPANMSALESLALLASENKPSLADTAKFKQWLGIPLSLKELLALMEVLTNDS